jgi:hypothetical protein
MNYEWGLRTLRNDNIIMAGRRAAHRLQTGASGGGGRRTGYKPARAVAEGGTPVINRRERWRRAAHYKPERAVAEGGTPVTNRRERSGEAAEGGAPVINRRERCGGRRTGYKPARAVRWEASGAGRRARRRRAKTMNNSTLLSFIIHNS